MALRVTIEPPKIPAAIAGRVPTNVILQERVRAVNEGVLFLTRIMTEVSPTGGTFLLEKSWNAGRRFGRQVANAVEGKAASPSIEALVWDEGTRSNPFPPVKTPPDEPVLAQWIRRQLGGAAFVKRRGSKVSADLSKLSQVREVAFAIGRDIKRRGLPNPDHPLGRKKGVFTKAFNASRAELQRIFENMNQRIIARFGG